MSNSLWSRGLQHARLPRPSPTPGACSNSCPLSQWCHPTISSSVVPFFSCLQSFPASGSFPVSQFFTTGGQSIGVSALASVLLMNIQDWFPLGYNTVYHCAFNFSLVPISISTFFCLFRGHSYFLFYEILVSIFCPFFCWDSCFFLTDSKEIFFILGYRYPPKVGLSLYHAYGWIKFLNFNVLQLLFYSFIVYDFCVLFEEFFLFWGHSLYDLSFKVSPVTFILARVAYGLL